eukprot:TRINITY_DN29992_c0_g1_i1.p1 TRINITY_DN29992_c0_g1~~TRINITY_DN29992_c0_g1_i1.p1  ORF type:complete len:214 (+),score=47.09 TRINITY_DN29992_c0_g1_i1:159-800(+)
MAHCRSCHAHLGWGFCPVDAAYTESCDDCVSPVGGCCSMEGMGGSLEEPANTDIEEETHDQPNGRWNGEGMSSGLVTFCGLVLTKMREKNLSVEEVNESFSWLERLHEYEAALLSLTHALQRAPPGFDLQSFWSLLETSLQEPEIDAARIRRIESSLAEAIGEFAMRDAQEEHEPAVDGEGAQGDPAAPNDNPGTLQDGATYAQSHHAEHAMT